MYKLIKIDEKFSDEQWQELFDVRQSQQPAIKFNFKTIQDMKDDVFNGYNSDDCIDYADYAIFDHNKRIIGEFYCFIDENCDENIGRLLRLVIFVTPELQTNDLITYVFSQLLKNYDNNLKIRLISENGLYDDWATRWGGVFKIHLENYQLKYSDLDLARLKDWTEKGKYVNPDLAIKLCDMNDLTETDLADVAYMWHTGMDASLTTDIVKKYGFKYQFDFTDVKKWICDQQQKWPMVVLSDQSDKIIGFSYIVVTLNHTTEDSNQKLQTSYMYKGMTYVKPEYRGRGLARWMNAELYLKVLGNYDFEVINSQMSPRNEFMIKINREFGYKKLENSYEKEYIFELSDIKKRLQQ